MEPLTEVVYLKMKGVDPSTHDVSTELVRCFHCAGYDRTEADRG